MQKPSLIGTLQNAPIMHDDDDDANNKVWNGMLYVVVGTIKNWISSYIMIVAYVASAGLQGEPAVRYTWTVWVWEII